MLDNDLLLSQCFIEYANNHAKYLKRHEHEKANLKKWLLFFPKEMVRNIRAPQQRKFIQHLVNCGYSKGYIKGIFKSGAAAMRFAWRNDLMPSPVPLLNPEDELRKHKAKATESARPLEIHEVAGLIEHSTKDEMIRFIVVLIGCACRPAAAIELDGSQINLEAGTINLLRQGEEQNNKYRPTVRLPTFIRAIYHPENIVYQKHKKPRRRPVDEIRKAWSGSVRRAGLGPGVTPRAVRNTMAKWLRQSEVAAWHTSSQLGHKRRGSEITEIYAPNDPAYLGKALEAIEQYFELLLDNSPKLRDYMSSTKYFSLRPRC